MKHVTPCTSLSNSKLRSVAYLSKCPTYQNGQPHRDTNIFLESQKHLLLPLPCNPLLPSNGNACFRQLGEATIVSFRVVVVVVVVVVRGAKVVREGRRKNAMSAAAACSSGGGEMKTGLFGPQRPARAGELREKVPLPTQANGNDARSTWPPPPPPPLPASSAAVAA